MFAGLTAGICKTNSDDVLASTTKNTRKMKSTIPAVDSPAMAIKGQKREQGIGILVLVDPLDFSSM